MLPKKLFVTPDVLRADYEELKTMQAVADRHGVSKKLILNYMKKFGIERTQRGDPEQISDEIRKLAAQGMNGQVIARHLKITSSYVYILAKKFGIQITDDFHKGYRITHNGYKLIMRPEHPEANRHGYVREHRIVAEEKLGRPLLLREVVHHINGDKLDNRPENIEVMTKEAHVSHHHTGKKGRGPAKPKTLKI